MKQHKIIKRNIFKSQLFFSLPSKIVYNYTNKNYNAGLGI